MAFPQNVVKMTWGGTLAAGEEIWSCGLYLNASIGDTSEVIPEQWAGIGALLPTYAAAVAQMHSDADTRIPTGVRLEWVKLALLGVNGNYIAEAHEYIYATAISGGVSLSYVPQVSCVVTLVSDRYKDPGKYNRFYLPAAPPVGSGAYKLTQAQTVGIADSVAPFIEALDTVYTWEGSDPQVSGSIFPVVASKSYNELMPVVKLRVGDVLDTQRRRRNKIYETYTEVETDIAS